MIKFAYHKYNLVPVAPIGALATNGTRQGALFRIMWPDGGVGYADLFPWPEVGDHEIDIHIEALERGKISLLLEQTIWLARKDAEARTDHRSLFATGARVKNHFLINDYTKFSDSTMKDIKSAGFTTIKVKCGRDFNEEAGFVSRFIRQNPGFLVRLDFNAKASFAEFERFLSHFHTVERAKIEFIEDPMPLDFEAWTEARKLIAIAADFEFEKLDASKAEAAFFDILILKPARTDIDSAMKLIDRWGLKMCVTSSLDHPVGVAHACAVASRLKKFYPNRLLDCGCLSLKSYQPNDFTNSMFVQGPYLTGIPGTGIGFDDLFKRIEWTPIKIK